MTAATDTTAKFWSKIFSAMDKEARPSIGRSGYIPVFDGSQWRLFKNTVTIYVGAENCADPAKVDLLRQNVVNLLDHYPDTVKQLEKLGLRVRSLLNRRINTVSDVITWANSPFNAGPTDKHPLHVQDTVDLAYDDFLVIVKNGREPIYVIPMAPRGEGMNQVLDFSRPGCTQRFGPRHEYTKLAFTRQVEPKVKEPRYRGKTAEGEPRRPRGRPRKDGLVPGSPQAKAADRKKEQERIKKREERANGKKSTAKVTRIRPAPRRRLARVGHRQQASGE